MTFLQRFKTELTERALLTGSWVESMTRAGLFDATILNEEYTSESWLQELAVPVDNDEDLDGAYWAGIEAAHEALGWAYNCPICEVSFDTPHDLVTHGLDCL